jgi:hypothetical protein
VSIAPIRWPRWRQLWRASFADWRLFGQASILAVLVRLRLRQTAIDAMTGGAGPVAPKSHPSGPAADALTRTAHLVELAVGVTGGGTCLTRSLVLCRLLRRSGVDAEVVVGTTRPGERLEAHAWVRAGNWSAFAPPAGEGYSVVLATGSTVTGSRAVSANVPAV